MAAAGNEYTCNDDVPTYPASYDLANVVAGQRTGPRAAVCWCTAWLAHLQPGLPACCQAAPLLCVSQSLAATGLFGAVAATDADDTLAMFSNWGKSSVHLASPGTMVLNTW